MELPPQYPDEFLEIIPHVLKLEGGYSNLSADPGGETNYGISKRAFPHLDIKNLTEAEAIEIYYTHYWLPTRPHLIPPHLRFVVFDCAVNNGVRPAIRLLQELAGVHRDGVMGKITAAKAEKVTAEAYLAARKRLYERIIARRPASRVFMGWWLVRLRTLKRIIWQALNVAR